MNVSTLARMLKLTTAELLEKLPQMGFDIGSRAIKIDDRLVEKIVKSFDETRKKEQMIENQNRIKEIKLDKGAAPQAEKVINLSETIVVRELAERLNVPLVKVMSELMKNGVIISLNEKIDYETAAIISEDLGYKVEKNCEAASGDNGISNDCSNLKELLSHEKENLQPKPPVVVVMGHVDHGKTKLLDAIRKTNVIDKESGGITQHIGAYQIKEKDRPITFIDTPGHEAFKAMRSRGSQVADLAIVVVAADEGLKPQTIEVFEMVQKENLPFIVAINKIDKEGADIEKVKKELSELNIIPEDWGGKTICVQVSAKQGTGIKELLDMVLLLADLSNFQTNPNRSAIGTIIESHVDKGEGPVATVLISTGTLRVGDFVEIGRVVGRIRMMKDFLGNNTITAVPSMPVKILGLKNVPPVGDILKVITDKKLIKQKVKEGRSIKIKPAATDNKDGEKKKKLSFPLILKADVLGSQEAIINSLNKINKPEINISLIKKGLGAINEVDVAEAFGAKALVIGFHVRVIPAVEKLAKEKNVEIKIYDVIYKLLEELNERLDGLIKPEMVRVELGKIKVLKIFRTIKDEQIIGGKVLVGKVINQTKIKIIRGDQILGFADLIQLQSNRQDVTEVIIGQECGLKLKGKIIVQPEDTLEIYQEQI